MSDERSGTPLARAEAAVLRIVALEDLPDAAAIVRAVLEAVREPSADQVKVAWAEAADGADPADLYTAMIDTLLRAR